MFFAEEQCVIFTSHPLLAIKKNMLPALLLSNIAYNFSCHRDTQYAHLNNYRTDIINLCQNLLESAKFQTPNSCNIFTCSGKSLTPVMFSESAIGQHLLDKPMCTKNYSDEKFTILLFGSSSFHLSATKAVYIKSCKPNICCQKEFVYNLKLLH